MMAGDVHAKFIWLFDWLCDFSWRANPGKAVVAFSLSNPEGRHPWAWSESLPFLLEFHDP